MTFPMPTQVKEASPIGLYGVPTATLDWCEANYQWSYYIAEMANSTSNLVTIFCAVYGACKVIEQRLATRYLVGYLGFALVGLGSFAFHASLLYTAQLADELPMIYVASMSMCLLYDREQGFEIRTLRTKLQIVGLVIFDILFTRAYSIYRNPVFHQVVFAVLIITCAARVIYLLHYSDVRGSIPQEKRSLISKWFLLGAFTFAFGFFIWNLDSIFCDILKTAKAHFGYPLAFLLEGHAWWHVISAMGTYYMFVGVTYLTLCIKDDHRKYTVVGCYLPHVERLAKN